MLYILSYFLSFVFHFAIFINRIFETHITKKYFLVYLAVWKWEIYMITMTFDFEINLFKSQIHWNLNVA